MTPNDVKAALSSGLTKTFLVATLVAEGHAEAHAWLVVRGAEIARLADELDQIDAEGAAEGRRIHVMADLGVQAGELLRLLTVAAPGRSPAPRGG